MGEMASRLPLPCPEGAADARVERCLGTGARNRKPVGTKMKQIPSASSTPAVPLAPPVGPSADGAKSSWQCPGPRIAK